ncbi:AbrB/MazE/SpoVT family DNA-binding domain-containing protein [Candidatus Woesearchaeota archaeon]|nr:AbrB/MazE/SpoVT family DNA-binding domain-containing protein [Candidatus Woesearchaeota archaeon]
MDCPVCKGKMEKVDDKIEQDGVEFEAYKCQECGEEIMTMAQLKDLAHKYRKLKNAKEVVFKKWGNSLALRIPNEIANEYKIAEGKSGYIIREKEGIRILPKKS